MKTHNKKSGFTIVELLIVVVVIAILAAITIVSFNGISQRATSAALQADVNQAMKRIESAKVTSAANLYPLTQAELGLTASDGATITYNTVNGASFCVESRKGDARFSSSSSNLSLQPVGCDKNGLVGHWPLNGNANDVVGSVNGVVSGASLTSGQSGQSNTAYNFVPANSSIITFPAGYTLQEITKSLWFRTTALAGGSSYPTLFDIGSPGNAVYLEQVSNGAVLSGVRARTGGTNFANISNEVTTGALAVGQWIHVAQVITPSNMQLYINGNPSSARAGDFNLAAANQPSSIGGGRSYFNGAIDDVRVYNRALNAAEVQAMFTAGAE